MTEGITDPLRRRIAYLAKEARGVQPRRAIFESKDGPSRSAYTHFENLKSWPWPATMSKIEQALGWRHGVVDDILQANPDPQRITGRVLRGELPIPGATQVDLQLRLPIDIPAGLTTEQKRTLQESLESGNTALTGLNSDLSEFSDYQLMRELTLRMALREAQ